MTIGNRIVQKRKELGLSQEALGEQLGVSRQAIYKWESDSTLPEIEKLVSLSRIFDVSVGWLLGVEDTPSAGSSELNETQMKMVREIVDSYLSAQPEPVPQPKRRRWLWVVAAAVCIALVITLWNLSEQLLSIKNQTHYLQSSISMVETSVASQISSITDRVEEVLKSQNNLTADYETDFLGVDESGTMATFSFRVIPKTYQEGMTAWIDIANEYARITFGPYEANREVFTGEFTIALTDSTTIYIVFEHNGIRQTQLLDSYEGLYRSSFPAVYLECWPLFFDIDDKTDTLTEELNAAIRGWEYNGSPQTLEDMDLLSCRIGLFADQQLVEWFTPGTRTLREMLDDGSIKETEEECFLLESEGIVLDREKIYCIAAVLVDKYGREFVISDAPACCKDGDGWTDVGSYSNGPHFEGWIY